MKVRIFRKCINRKKDYKYYPHYTHLIFGIGLGEDTKYKCEKISAYRKNDKWSLTINNQNYETERIDY